MTASTIAPGTTASSDPPDAHAAAAIAEPRSAHATLIATSFLREGRSGALEIHGGVDFQWLGDNLRALNDDDRVKPIGLIGFTYTY